MTDVLSTRARNSSSRSPWHRPLDLARRRGGVAHAIVVIVKRSSLDGAWLCVWLERVPPLTEPLTRRSAHTARQTPRGAAALLLAARPDARRRPSAAMVKWPVLALGLRCVRLWGDVDGDGHRFEC